LLPSVKAKAAGRRRAAIGNKLPDLAGFVAVLAQGWTA
jgi:hypothetical protein